MPKKVKQKEEGMVHVRIESPLAIRKSVLGSAINNVNILKTYENLKEIRLRKVKVLEDVKYAIANLHSLVKQLRHNYLPEIQQEEEKSRQVIAVKTAGKEVSNTEVDKLKAELNDIERKLRNI